MVSKFQKTSEYDITPWGYLGRAKKQLLNRSPESVFYAALEMRFAIEARAREHLLSLENIPRKIINMWHAEKVMQEMEKRIEGVRQPVAFSFRYKKQKVRPLTYIPVSKDILVEYGKLGNLLHVQRKHVSVEFIKDKKIWLNNLVEKMDKVCRGHMLRAPQWKIICSKCKQYIPWQNISTDSDLIICSCGHRGALLGREMTMLMTVRKKSQRSLELLQAEYIKGEI